MVADGKSYQEIDPWNSVLLATKEKSKKWNKSEICHYTKHKTSHSYH